MEYSALTYGLQFDLVCLQQAGPSRYVAGETFYKVPANTLYTNPILKLHGSLNWFRFTGEQSTFGPWRKPEALADGFEDQVCLGRVSSGDDFLFGFGRQAGFGGWETEPVIVPPVLGKNLRRPYFRELWASAKQALATCRRLVVIGYSFPPTDFHVRKLLLEAFVDNTPDDIVVVNPDTSVVSLVKDLSHYRGVIGTASDLGEFLASSPARLSSEEEAGFAEFDRRRRDGGS